MSSNSPAAQFARALFSTLLFLFGLAVLGFGGLLVFVGIICGGLGTAVWIVPISVGLAYLILKAAKSLRKAKPATDSVGWPSSYKPLYNERIAAEKSDEEAGKKLPSFAEAKSIADYIRAARNNGSDDEAITAELTNVGWSKEVIDFAYSML